MTREYKLFKVTKGKEKLVKIFGTMQEAEHKVRNILGLREFQNCNYTELFDGVMCIGMDFTKDGDCIFRIKKEVQWNDV